jgi:uncharacterized BrkB/YihY/UPF0761 family membrane protein
VDLRLGRFRRSAANPAPAAALDPVLRPIPGRRLDPPARPVPRTVQRVESRRGRVGLSAGVLYRAVTRFNHARSTLLAAGTAYYLFLALLSGITLVYGLTAALGAERLADWVTTAITAAFPGSGIDSVDIERLRSSGQTTSIVSGVGLLYGATGSVMAASRSLHIVYGAPKDARPFVVARLRAVGWLLLLAPLVLLSYLAATVASTLSSSILDLLGLDWDGPRVAVNLLAAALTMAVDLVIVYLVLANLGGIRPGRGALVWGASVGMLATEVVKLATALLIGLVVAKPQYGALAAPIGIMFVLFLQAAVLYGSAALTAAIAEGSTGDPSPDPVVAGEPAEEPAEAEEKVVDPSHP